MSWVGSEEDNTDMIQRTCVHQSNLLHRVGEARDKEKKQALGRFDLHPSMSDDIFSNQCEAGQGGKLQKHEVHILHSKDYIN